MMEMVELVLWILLIAALAPSILALGIIALIGVLTAIVHGTLDRKRH